MNTSLAKDHTGVTVSWSEPWIHPKTNISQYNVTLVTQNFTYTSYTTDTYLFINDIEPHSLVNVSVLAINIAGAGGTSSITGNTSAGNNNYYDVMTFTVYHSTSGHSPQLQCYYY